MIRDAIRTTILAVALAGASAAGADYAAGQQAWDAGRPAEALSEWRAAADAGDRRAMLALGRRYAQGFGVVQDYVEAHKWLNLAASLGEAAAVEERDALAARMTPQQVATAQERAIRTIAKHRGAAEGSRGGSAPAARAAPRPGSARPDALLEGRALLRDCAECPELVVVPAGSFEMGSPESEAGRNDDEGPVHRVRIERPFAVGVYEVTFAEWDACVSGGGCGGYRPDDEGWGRGNRPVINVNWEDARSYVDWLSKETGEEYRLLSESEWEYVARGGTRTPFYTGETISTGQANYDGRFTYGSGPKGLYRGRTVAVGSFDANGYGLRDMHGNVREWVEDCWNGSYRGAPADGSAWASGNCSRRVLRGGSWVSRPWHIRSALRIRLFTGGRNSGSGFRVARMLAP